MGFILKGKSESDIFHYFSLFIFWRREKAFFFYHFFKNGEEMQEKDLEELCKFSTFRFISPGKRAKREEEKRKGEEEKRDN